MKKAVIFDMDGVLVDNADIHRKAWVQFSEQQGHPITIEDFEQIGFGDVNRRYLEFVFNRKLSEEEVNTLAHKKEEVYRELFKKEIAPVNGLIEFLKEVRDSGLKTAVGTSAPRVNLDFVMDRLELRSYFDVMVDDLYVHKGKPAPDIYLKAAELLNVEPAACVVIEDAYLGIEAAHRAGMTCIGLSTTYPPEKIAAADHIVKDFTELDVNSIKTM